MPAAPPVRSYTGDQQATWETSDWFGLSTRTLSTGTLSTGTLSTGTVAAAPTFPPPVPPRPVLPTYPPPGSPYARSPYASLGRRVLAYLVDILVVLGLFFLLGMIAGIVAAGEGSDVGIVLGGGAAILLLYFYVPESITGRTLGKLLLGVRVVRADDLVSPPGFGYGALRRVVFVCLDFVPLGALINLAVAGADRPERRAIHDRAAQTRVVRADWSPAEGYPSAFRQPTSTSSIVVITLACVVSGLLCFAMLVSVAFPVFLNQRAKGIDAQMRQDAEDAARALMTAQGTLAFPIVIEEGSVGVIGDATFEPAPGDSVRITVARDGSGAFCVRVANDDATSPVYLDSVSGTIGRAPCGYRGRITITKR